MVLFRVGSSTNAVQKFLLNWIAQSLCGLCRLQALIIEVIPSMHVFLVSCLMQPPTLLHLFGDPHKNPPIFPALLCFLASPIQIPQWEQMPFLAVVFANLCNVCLSAGVQM